MILITIILPIIFQYINTLIMNGLEMHKLKLTTLILSVLCAMVNCACADYPIISNRYLADPGSLVYNGRVYLYCSNDDESPVEGSYNIPNVVCVSSSDLKNWTDHGIVFDAAKDTNWAKKTWAPSPIERDGKFYLYFGNGGANIGVVCSDNPTGPFKDVRGSFLVDYNTPGVQPAQHMWLFDPCPFIDDDGQAYLYFGGNGDNNVRGVKLNRDMISLDGDVIKMTAQNFFEAAWVFKRNGTYYFAYSTTPQAGMRFDYQMSKKPMSEYIYGGIVSDQPPLNNNNHHAALFELNGNWYQAYHNRVVAKEAGIPTGFRRNLALDSFDFNPDGSIVKVVPSVDAVKQLGFLNPFTRVEGETFNAQKGVETYGCSEEGIYLGDIDNGDWVKIKGVDFAAGASSFTVAAACESKGGIIELRIGSLDGKLIGVCDISGTGGSQNWNDAKCRIADVSGVNDLYIKFVGGDGHLFNIDWWQFVK